MNIHNGMEIGGLSLPLAWDANVVSDRLHSIIHYQLPPSINPCGKEIKGFAIIQHNAQLGFKVLAQLYDPRRTPEVRGRVSCKNGANDGCCPHLIQPGRLVNCWCSTFALEIGAPIQVRLDPILHYWTGLTFPVMELPKHVEIVYCAYFKEQLWTIIRKLVWDCGLLPPLDSMWNGTWYPVSIPISVWPAPTRRMVFCQRATLALKSNGWGWTSQTFTLRIKTWFAIATTIPSWLQYLHVTDAHWNA